MFESTIRYFSGFRTRQSFMANQKLFFHPNYVTIIYSIKWGLAFLALQYTQNILGINLMMEGNTVPLMQRWRSVPAKWDPVMSLDSKYSY